MAEASAALGRLPAPRVPLIDERTGVMSREWYRFFVSLFQQVETDSTLVIPDFTPDPLAGAALLPGLSPSITDVLGVEPPLQPAPPAYYGAFYDTTTQTAAVINTAYAITFNTTRAAFGVRRSSTTSRITFDSPGVYSIQFRAQVDKLTAGSASLWLWGRQDGVDITDSATIIQVQSDTAEIGAAWDFLVTAAAGSYFELMWAVSSTSVVIQARAAAAPVPGIPSVTLTAVPVA